VSRLRVESGGATALSTPWSIGPSLSLPIFDAGRRSAAVDAAQARYAEARSRYEQRARDAVREVEEALVRLDAAQRREADASTAAQGFATFLEAQRKRTDAGAGSLLDLEEARRTALNAQSSLIAVQAERVSAWITLYRAVGGGWSVDLPTATAGTPRTLATAPTATR
jgi:outer membrane protein, multidrug efflux system